jgi:hypothetical protein
VSAWRTMATRASVTTSQSRARPAAVRPSRPLPRRPVSTAIACAGQPGRSGKADGYLPRACAGTPCPRRRAAPVLARAGAREA